MSVKDGFAPNFERILDDIRRERVRIIYVDELSRLTRVTEHLLRLQNLLRFHRVQLWSVHENVEVSDDNSDIHVIFTGCKNQVATRVARHRVKRGMDGNMRRRLSNGDIGFGYTSTELTADEVQSLGLARRKEGERPYKRLVVNETEAEIIRLVFRLYVHEKWSQTRIAKYVNKQGVRRGRKAKNHRWRALEVRKVLSNRKYIGYRVRNITEIKVHPETGKRTSRSQPPNAQITEFDESLIIVDSTLFEKAQLRLEKSKRVFHESRAHPRMPRRSPLMAYTPRKLLSGTLVCGESDATLVQKKSTHEYYYICPYTGAGGCTNTVQMRRDLAHKMVLDAVRANAEPYFVAERVHEMLVAEIRERAQSPARDNGHLSRELQTVRNKIRRLTDAIAERSSSKALLDALSSEEAERDRLEVAIRECERKTRTPEQIPTVEWVHGVLANGFPEPTQDDVTKWAHVIRRITGPIRMFPRQHPRLTTRYPVLRFTIDFCGVLSALAASDEHPADLPDDCGCTADIELEVRKVPLYEKHATAVVHMRDVEGLSWAEIARRLPDRTCAENCIAAYRYGRFGDPWSKQPLPKCRAARRDESCEAGS